MNSDVTSVLRPMSVLAWPASGANPYLDLLYADIRKLGVEVVNFWDDFQRIKKIDVVHIHWPEQIFWRGRSRLGLLIDMGRVIWALFRLKAAGTRIVLTAHNDRPHQLGRLTRLLWRPYRAMLSRLVDGTILLRAGSRNMFMATWPELADRPQIVIPHGHYRDAYPPRDSRLSARKRLDLPMDAPVLLFFGQIRHNKNVPALLRAFRDVEAREPILVIAGRCSNPKLQEEIETAAALDPRVRLHLDHIPDEAVPGFFAAADLAVLPFMHVTNSGSALLALSFDCPVLIPEMLSVDGLEAETVSAWVRHYSGAITGAVLKDALAWAALPRPAEAPLHALDWSLLARQTIGFYASLRDDHGSRT